MELLLYTKNINGNIIQLYGNRQSFRCRQRGRYINQSKIPSLQFISYKQCEKHIASGKQFYGPYNFNTISKL